MNVVWNRVVEGWREGEGVKKKTKQRETRIEIKTKQRESKLEKS
jgi:hypothetical protein